MTISLNWLSEYISVQFSPGELAERLTMLGIEVEAIERVGERWDKVIVGEVLEVSPHPNADKLRLASVSIGNGEPLRIVCGAPNVRAGLKVAVATIGADLGEGFVIKKAKIRGEASEGMICSERELGISNNHDGIWELPADTAIGLQLSDALGLRDVKFEVGITPNRADCLSHIGIAREIRAITGEALRITKVEPMVRIKKRLFLRNLGYDEKEIGQDKFDELMDSQDDHEAELWYKEAVGQIEGQVRVSLPEPDLCPRYVAKLVRGVTIEASPTWLKRRIESVCLRSINNVVDVTNFVLMECGHPLHAFDFGTVADGHVVVRTAKGFADEYATLDGKRRKLPPDALLITDGIKPLGIAGIMGGENSQITNSTQDVLIESAYFLPASIRRSAKLLGLSSDASYRFERGTDINILPYAAERAAQLIAEVSGGSIVDGSIDEYPKQLQRKSFSFRPARTNAIIGLNIPEQRMKEIFGRLEIECAPVNDGQWKLTGPSYRVDIEREEDAIEEVARIIGYEEIPTSKFERTPLGGMREPLKKRDFDALVRTTLLSLGANECVSLPLVSERNALQFHEHPVEILNPLNIERDRMRTSVGINLLEAARVSERFGAPGQRIFEMGNVFHYSDSPEMLGYVKEEAEIGILISGIQEPKTAYNAEQVYADFFLMKGIAESLLSRLGIRVFEYSTGKIEGKESGRFFDASQCLIVTSGINHIGLIGRINPEVTKEYDLRNHAWLALFNYQSLYDLTKKLVENPLHVKPLAKYPSIERDIAIVLGQGIPSKQVEETIRHSAPSDVLREVSLFDEFQSKEMKAAHERSLAFHLVFRSDDRTLEESEVDEHIKLIIKRLEGELQAQLRV